jgi:hypothetical protein
VHVRRGAVPRQRPLDRAPFLSEQTVPSGRRSFSPCVCSSATAEVATVEQGFRSQAARLAWGPARRWRARGHRRNRPAVGDRARGRRTIRPLRFAWWSSRVCAEELVDHVGSGS